MLKIEGIAADYNRNFDLTERLLTQSQVVWNYLYLIFIANENNMALYHDAFPIIRALDIKTSIAIAGHCLVIMAAIFLRKKQPIVFIGVAWFYTGHLIESTVIALEIMFEHRNYLPMYGPILIFSYYFSLLLQKLSLSLRLIIIICVVLALSLQTFLRVLDWQSELSLAIAQVKKQPDSIRARSVLTTILLSKGQRKKAIQVLQTTINQYPNNIESLLQYNSLFCEQASLPKGIAEQTKNNLSHAQSYENPINKLALLINLYKQGKCNNLEPFLIVYINALASNKHIQYHHNTITAIYFFKAKVYSKQKNVKQAEYFYQKAYENDRTNRAWRTILEQAEFYLSLALYKKTQQIVTKIKENYLKTSTIQSNNFKNRYNQIIKQLMEVEKKH